VAVQVLDELGADVGQLGERAVLETEEGQGGADESPDDAGNGQAAR
jgi:hypothetical protein